MVSRSSIDFLSVSSASLRRCPLPPAVTGRMGFNKDLSRHPPTMTALQPPSQTSTVELKAPPPTSPRSPSTDIWLDTNYRGHLRPSFSFSTFCAFLFSIFFFCVRLLCPCVPAFKPGPIRVQLIWHAKKKTRWVSGIYMNFNSAGRGATCNLDKKKLSNETSNIHPLFYLNLVLQKSTSGWAKTTKAQHYT